MRQKPFERKSDDDKLNPNSLREVFTYVREILSGDNVEEFARKAKPFCGRYKKKNLPAKTVRGIEEDEKRIQYWHIEVYAQMLGIPSGVLLLFSRLKANAEAGKDQDTIRILEALNQVLATHDPRSAFDCAKLAEWSAVFRGKQERLF